MQPPRLPQTRVLRLLLPTSLLLMAFGASATLLPEDDGANLEDTRSMIAEWVETRRVYSEEMANAPEYLLNLFLNYDNEETGSQFGVCYTCLLYTSPSPRDTLLSRMPSSA